MRAVIILSPCFLLYVLKYNINTVRPAGVNQAIVWPPQHYTFSHNAGDLWVEPEPDMI